MSVNQLSKQVFIVDALRTPVGSPNKSLKNFSVTQLSSLVIKEIVQRNKIKKQLIDEVILGNTVSAGTGQNFARQAVILSGLPENVPAYTVNNVCGAGLQSVILAARSILSGQAHLVVTGGVESVSHCPQLISGNKQEDGQEQRFFDSLLHDGLFCQITGKRMGELCEDMAEEYGITREEQDLFALESHRKACAAQDQKKFLKEVVSCPVSANKVFVDKDERPRKNISLGILVSLPPAFRKGGTITAGNSSVPADGAGAFVLASKDMVKKLKMQPKARILGYVSIALNPQRVFEAGISAIQKCLHQCQLSVQDIDLFEISEAFAAQAILTKNRLKILDKKMNIWGGDIALGHPLGAAGTRILVTLMHALIDQKKKRGLACVCLGGGGAVAVVVEVI